MAFSGFAVSCMAAFIALTEGVQDSCTDPDGNRLTLGDTWDEGPKLRECVTRDMFYPFFSESFGEMNPPEPYKLCLYNGCPVDGSSTEIVKEGETFRHGNDECICRKGTSPTLADFSTLYHGACPSPYGEDYLIFDL